MSAGYLYLSQISKLEKHGNIIKHLCLFQVELFQYNPSKCLKVSEQTSVTSGNSEQTGT